MPPGVPPDTVDGTRKRFAYLDRLENPEDLQALVWKLFKRSEDAWTFLRRSVGARRTFVELRGHAMEDVQSRCRPISLSGIQQQGGGGSGGVFLRCTADTRHPTLPE